MPVVELPSGPVAYEDTGGDGPVVVLCHGVPMDHRACDRVMPLLTGMRVVRPTLPMGGHRMPMDPSADLTQLGMAGILADLLDALDLRDVTLVLNDWGGGQLLINLGRTERVGRMVLAACEAFDNFPPGPGALLAAAGRVPPLMWLLVQAMRWRPLRQARFGYGAMAVSGVPDHLLRDWFAPSQEDPRIRRDFARFAAGAPPRAELRRLAAQWPAFTRPVLVVWAAQDPLMPADHGPRLAALYPDARLEVLDDCSTLIGLDQPERFAALLRELVF
mgnify:CR=1 FL=1